MLLHRIVRPTSPVRTRSTLHEVTSVRRNSGRVTRGRVHPLPFGGSCSRDGDWYSVFGWGLGRRLITFSVGASRTGLHVRLCVHSDLRSSARRTSTCV